MTKFTIECTLPPEGKTFVEAPNARGTMDIVYSCLAVIFLCTWGVQHLNVPPQTIPKGWWQRRARALSRVLTKMKWMGFNVLAPEWPLAQAVCGLVNQYQVRKAFSHLKECDKVPWSGSHTQLANMGGFVVRFDPSLHNSTDCKGAAEPNEDMHCVVDEYCCNCPDMVSPRSLWCRAHLRNIGIWMKRYRPHENAAVATRHRSTSVDISSGNPNPSLSKKDPPTDSVIPHLSSRRASFDRAILTEDQSVVPLPDHPGSNDTTSDHETEADLLARATFEKVYNLLRGQCSYGWGCPHDISTSGWSGDTKWKLDATNLMVARAAIATLDVKHFGDENVTNRFMSSHPTIWLTNLRVLCGDRWCLDANQLLLVRRFGIINQLPSVTEDEIDDLNKSDLFVKILAVIQILWLCIQLCERLKRHIPTTQLEIVALAFTVCSILAYALFLSRPKDVQTVHEMDAARYPTPPEMAHIAAAGPSVLGYFREDITIPNNAVHLIEGQYWALSTNIAMIVFGALHVVSWNYEFPSQVEKTLWRASIVATITAVPVMFCLALLAKLSFDKSLLPRLRRAPRFRWLVTFGQFYLLAPVFVAARFFIIVETIRSLAYQPPEAFRSTWAAEIPNVS